MADVTVESVRQAAKILEDAILSSDRLFWTLSRKKCDCLPLAKWTWRNGGAAPVFDESPRTDGRLCPYAALVLPTEAETLIREFRKVGGESIEVDAVRIATAGPPAWRTSWLTALEWCDAFFERLAKWKAAHDHCVEVWWAAKESGDAEKAADLPMFVGAAFPGFGPLRREVLDGVRGETAATIRWLMDREPAAKAKKSANTPKKRNLIAPRDPALREVFARIDRQKAENAKKEAKGLPKKRFLIDVAKDYLADAEDISGPELDRRAESVMSQWRQYKKKPD